MSEVLYKNTFARTPQCSRRRLIDESEISTPVAIDLHAANYLKEAVRSITAIRSKFRSLSTDGTLRRTPACVSSCFMIVDPLLPNSHPCGTVPLHTSSYCMIDKYSLSKADNPAPFKFRKLEFILISSWRHT
ncbi:hypothetical protein TNCV_3902041 [Trichonephila clavipes]|nr:hypothetical protein TNCV_3902041 [Trichonephila clavipes]